MATRNIGGSITLEGASKYNSDLKAIKSNLQELRSEMKLANAENQNAANSYTALAQKEEILNKQIEQTTKKLEIYNKMYDDSAKSQKKAEESIQTYSTKLQDAQKELERMQKSGTATDEELKNQQKVVSDLEKELEKAQNGYNSASLKMNQYQTAANNTNADLQNLNGALAENEKYMEEAKNSTDGTATSIDKFGKVVDKAGEGMAKTADAVQMLASSEAFNKIAEGAKKVTETLLDCVEASTKWGTSMAKVQSIAQVSDAELSGMGKSIQDLAATYGVGANEIAEATYQAISASVDAAHATEFVEDSIKLARGGFTDVTSAVDVMTTVTNAYGKEANTTAHIMDTLIQTQNLGKTTVNELAESLGMVIPTAAAYSVNLDNVASAYIQMTKNGINTANATTMLNGMLTELADAGSTVSKTLKEKTGKSFGQLMKDGKSLGDVIQILGDTVNGDSEAFANLWGNVRAGRGAITIFNNGADAFNASMTSIAESTGSADKAFATMADTAEMTDQRLQAATDNLKIAIGEALEPTLNDLKQSGLEALEPLTKFVEDNPILIQTIAGTVTAVAGVATAVTACAAAVAILRAAFGDLSGALAVLGTAAVIGGVAAYSAAVEDTANKTGKLISETRKLGEELNKNEAERKQNREELQANAVITKDLAGELTNLQKKTNLSVEEQARQREIVAELNALLPELNLQIDEQTGKLDEHSAAVLKDVDALQKQAIAQAAQKDMQEISAGLVEADKKRIEISRELSQAVSELKDTEAEWREELAAGSDQANVLSDRMVTQKQDIADLEKALKEADGVYKEQNGLLEEATSYYKEASAAVEEHGETQEEVTEKVRVLSEEEKEALEKRIKALQEFKDGVASTVSSINPLFDELKTTMEGSLNSITEHLTKNGEAAQKFADSINAATSDARYGVSTEYTELVNNLASKGPEATGLLNDLANGAKEGSDKFTEAMTAMRESLEGENSVAEATANLTDSVDTHFTTVKDYVTKGESDITTEMEEGGTDQEKAVETTTKNVEKIATDGVKNTAKAVSDNSAEVVSATQTATEEVVKTAETVLGISGGSSSVFQTMGSTTMKSFAEGVKQEASAVKKALEEVLQTAIDSMDISGLAGRIDKALGERINT